MRPSLSVTPAVQPLLVCLLCLPAIPFAYADGVQNTPPSIRYGLTERSTYQEGCYPPCHCPLYAEQPIRGGFVLTPTGTDDDGFNTFDVTVVEWRVLAPDNVTINKLTGHGTYRVKPNTATGVQQLKLSLLLNDRWPLEFDSGLEPGGFTFPNIDITITVNNYVCYDYVIRVVAQPKLEPPDLPRRAIFVLHPCRSSLELTLFTGTSRGKLAGSLRLLLGDPNVPVPALAGLVGLSVRSASLVAPDLEPNLPGVPQPLEIKLDPREKSLGSYNFLNGEIAFDLFLVSPNGGLPVPMPVHLRGHLGNAGLEVKGSNGNIPDGTLKMAITAFEVKPPPPAKDLWFSTEFGFGADTVSPASLTITPVSDGDLLSRRGHIVRRNRELLRNLGIMPPTPDLGLDAVTLARPGQIWFSFEETSAPIWSESLGRRLSHGDLLSDRGFVVATNEQLLKRFERMPIVSDVGLDAVTRAPNRAIFFSTEESFFSESLGVRVNHGDLLSSRGRIVRTNQQLLENFDIVDLTLGPLPPEYGLDAVILRPNGEIWFSTDLGFHIRENNSSGGLRWISDGDLLSTRGHVVAKNLDLVSEFNPVEDIDNFGLDAVNLTVPIRLLDFDLNGEIDENDLTRFNAAGSSPDIASHDPESSDFDGDGDADIADLAIAQQVMGLEGALKNGD